MPDISDNLREMAKRCGKLDAWAGKKPKCPAHLIAHQAAYACGYELTAARDAGFLAGAKKFSMRLDASIQRWRTYREENNGTKLNPRFMKPGRNSEGKVT